MTEQLRACGGVCSHHSDQEAGTGTRKNFPRPTPSDLLLPARPYLQKLPESPKIMSLGEAEGSQHEMLENISDSKNVMCKSSLNVMSDHYPHCFFL